MKRFSAKYLGLLALVILDAVLIFLAMNRTAPKPADTPTPRPSATASAEASPSASPDAALAEGVVEPPFSVANNVTMWRANTGSCEDGRPGQVFRSLDAGDKWEKVGNAEGEVLRVLGIDSNQALVAYAVKAQDGCTNRGSITRDGATWSDVTEGTNGLGFHRSAAEPDSIVTPDGLAQVCQASSVVEVDVPTRDRVVVLCSNGRVRVGAGGSAYETVAKAPGAVALAASPNKIWLAFPAGTSCGDDIAVREIASQEYGCQKAPKDKPISLDEAAGKLVLLAGQATAESPVEKAFR